jgi:hypothetical protein
MIKNQEEYNEAWAYLRWVYTKHKYGGPKDFSKHNPDEAWKDIKEYEQRTKTE